MIDGIELPIRIALIGIGATAIMDLWALFLKYGLGIPLLDYAMVGRWLGYLPQGRLTHPSIAKTASIRGEAAIGWLAHYAIGILFAASMIAIVGLEWACHPTMLPAVAFGVFSVVAPFFILQPGMGAGVGASKTPRPNTARLRSLIAHTSFGIGMYLAALALVHLSR